jgi:hypothetical protein
MYSSLALLLAGVCSGNGTVLLQAADKRAVEALLLCSAGTATIATTITAAESVTALSGGVRLVNDRAVLCWQWHCSLLYV